MSDYYMSVRDYMKQCIAGELTEERLKAYGGKLDEYSQKYASGRATDGNYNRKIEEELNNLIGYLEAGLPDIIDRIKRRGRDPKDFLQEFIRDHISEETLSHLMKFPPDTLEDKSLEEALA